jgi:hypothetical protein
MARVFRDLVVRPLVLAVAGCVLAVLVIGALLGRLLPGNPFAQTTTVRSSPVVLRSITRLSRYEAASGSFQVMTTLRTGSKSLPAVLEGSQTVVVGQGSDVAYVDFTGLGRGDVRVSRNAVTVSLPRPRLEPAVLNLAQSHVFTQQEGLLNRISGLVTGDSGAADQAAYVAAQRQVQAAAQHSPLLAEARRNTTAMLDGMLTGLGFTRVTVTYK